MHKIGGATSTTKLLTNESSSKTVFTRDPDLDSSIRGTKTLISCSAYKRVYQADKTIDQRHNLAEFNRNFITNAKKKRKSHFVTSCQSSFLYPYRHRSVCSLYRKISNQLHLNYRIQKTCLNSTAVACDHYPAACGLFLPHLCCCTLVVRPATSEERRS